MRERSDRPLAPARSSGSASPSGSGEVVGRRRGTRWPWVIVAIAVGALKLEAFASLLYHHGWLHHRGPLIAVLAVGLGVSVLRTRPVAIAVFGAGVLAFVVALHPLLGGVALGVGAFGSLIALFFTVSTVLHARQRRGQRA